LDGEQRHRLMVMKLGLKSSGHEPLKR
jgi:hypothetical protein